MSRAARVRLLPRGPWRQRGFSLIAVIFMIVVLAALGAFAVSISLSQQQTGNLALLEARTAAAAQAGIEYGAYRVLASSSNCVASQTLPLTGGTLKGFAVTVTCAQPPTNHGNGHLSFRLTATATTGAYGTPDFVSRTAATTVTSP
jgi:MSHA biogenesis protein MshP